VVLHKEGCVTHDTKTCIPVANGQTLKLENPSVFVWPDWQMVPPEKVWKLHVKMAADESNRTVCKNVVHHDQTDTSFVVVDDLTSSGRVAGYSE